LFLYENKILVLSTLLTTVPLTCHMEAQRQSQIKFRAIAIKLIWGFLPLPQAYNSLHVCMNLLKLSTLYPRQQL